MRANRSLPLVAVASLMTGLGAGLWSPPVSHGPAADGTGPAGPVSLGTDDPLTLARHMSKAYAQPANQVGPAVVLVKTYRRTSRGRRNVLDGSGVIVRSDGVVVTNNHVVRGADEFEVILTNGRRLSARVLGTDKDSDLAVLRVDAQGLTFAPLDPDINASVGEIVLAMGNPMGLGHTVTSGIVSGLGRTDLNIAFYEDFIQTDAAINPGNSGGPLINLEGQVLGINTAVGIASNGDNGIAFAIPSRMVRRVVDDVLEYGMVKRGFLGVEAARNWAAGRVIDSARRRGYRGFSKVVVDVVEEDSPADRAGLMEHDIIVEIHELPITDQKSFRTAIADVTPGEPTSIKIWRSGKERSLPVTMILREQ